MRVHWKAIPGLIVVGSFLFVIVLATVMVVSGSFFRDSGDHTLSPNGDATSANGLQASCRFKAPFLTYEQKTVDCMLQATPDFISRHQNELLDLSLETDNAFVDPFSVRVALDVAGRAAFTTKVRFIRDGQQKIRLKNNSEAPFELINGTVSVGTTWLYAFSKYSVVSFWLDLLIALPLYLYINAKAKRDRAAETERAIQRVEKRAEESPERAKFAWDLARVKLENYFDRNLSQVNQIFWLAVVVMLIGFGLICIGIFASFYGPRITPAAVATASGIISELIGVTFMAIYRSTMAQANEFMAILERINTVGMAVQILDSIPETEQELKNATRAQIVSLLIDARVKPQAREPRIQGDKQVSARNR